MKPALTIVGSTTDGKPVVSGVYAFKSTYGLPIADLLLYLKEKNITVSIPHLIQEGKKDGAGDNFAAEVDHALVDVFGRTVLPIA